MLCASLGRDAHAQHRGHSHGTAQLNIVIEGRRGTVEFIAAGEDLYGFEGPPRTTAQRDARAAAVARLRNGVAELVIFDASLGCRFTVSSDSTASRSDGHDDVRTVFDLACERPPAGRDIRFAVSRGFPAIRTLEVQLLSDTVQIGRRIVGDRGSVRP
jgi:hypothetical protein